MRLESEISMVIILFSMSTVVVSVSNFWLSFLVIVLIQPPHLMFSAVIFIVFSLIFKFSIIPFESKVIGGGGKRAGRGERWKR